MNILKTLLFLMIISIIGIYGILPSCSDDDDDNDSGDDDDDDNDNDDDNDDNDDDDTGPSTEDCEPYNYDLEASIVRGPYLQHVTQTSIRILWQTDIPSNSIVRFGPTDDLGYFHCNLEDKRYHEVTIENLSPETNYHYVVRSNSTQSEKYIFSTAPNLGTPFSFAVYGDNRTQPAEHQLVAEAIEQKSPDFIINVGDVVEDGWDIRQYNSQFFDQVGKLMTTTPMYISIGNHESESIFYFRFFSFPGNEKWYSFDYGNARFIALDSNWPFWQGSRQYLWFKEELQRTQADQVEWVFVFCHHPAYSESSGGGEEDVRNILLPVMEQYGVDVFLNGHVHNYERGELNGVYHLLSGGGGGPLSSVSQDLDHVIFSDSRYHFVNVQIDGKTATFDAIGQDNLVFDSFTIQH